MRLSHAAPRHYRFCASCIPIVLIWTLANKVYTWIVNHFWKTMVTETKRTFQSLCVHVWVKLIDLGGITFPTSLIVVCVWINGTLRPKLSLKTPVLPSSSWRYERKTGSSAAFRSWLTSTCAAPLPSVQRTASLSWSSPSHPIVRTSSDPPLDLTLSSSSLFVTLSHPRHQTPCACVCYAYVS